MKKINGWFLIACIVILLAIVILEPSFGWTVRSWLSPRPPAESAENASLEAQNEALAAQLAVLHSVSAQIPNASPNYLRAMAYSRYPFNFKNEILVNAGTDQGIAQGKAVVFQGILVGNVAKTYSDSSLVDTIFDNDSKMPVRIGTNGYDGLLIGGAYPRVTSIQKAAVLAQGDIIYSADPRFPYGLPVGIVMATTTSPDALFEEASVSFAYDINSIQTVLIAK